MQIEVIMYSIFIGCVLALFDRVGIIRIGVLLDCISSVLNIIDNFKIFEVLVIIAL